MAVYKTHSAIADINDPLKLEQLPVTSVTGDAQADRWVITVMDGDGAADLSGLGASAQFIRRLGSAAADTVVIADGTISGNTVTVVLPQACYVYDGAFQLAVSLTDTGESRALYVATGMIIRSQSGNMIDPGTVIPSVQEMITRIQEAEATITGFEQTIIDNPGSTVIDPTLSLSGAAADAKAAGDKIKEIVDGIGFERFHTTGTANKEVGKFYPVAGKTYNIVGKSNNKVTAFDFYEFYTGGTNSRVFTTTGNTDFNWTYKAANNVSYLRMYVGISGGTGEAEAVIFSIDEGKSNLSFVLQKMFMASYTMNTLLQQSNLYGFTGVGSLPPNKIFAVSQNVTSAMFSDLPAYGDYAGIVCFSPRPQYADNRFTVYLYVNSHLDAYVGFNNAGAITWRDIFGAQKIVDDLFSTPEFYEKSGFSARSELIKFYPTVGKKYDIYLYDLVNCDIELYEFKTGGTYTDLGRVVAPNGIYHYTPVSDVNYLRIYIGYNGTGGQTGTAKAAIMGSNNVLTCVENTRNLAYADFILTKEFSAVRKFTVIGDSMASGYYKETSEGGQHGRNLEYSWPQIMARVYGQQAQNATLSGVTCKTWWEDSQGVCKAMVTASKRSQVYIMALGTNDYKDIPDSEITAAEIGSASDVKTDYTQNGDTFWGNYCKILQYVHDVAPDAKIICCTIPAPRPNSLWKQTAIREICALQMFADYVCLCDLRQDYADLSSLTAMQSEMWQSHFTPGGYANSAEFLMYAFSRTIQNNRVMFINLPLIPYD